MSGNFEMTVSTYPNSNINLKEEIKLMKIGLLYSDKITVKSLKADMIYRVLEYKHKKSLLDRLYYIRDMYYLGLKGDVNEIEDLIENYRKVKNVRLDNPKKVIAKKNYEKHISNTWKNLGSSINNVIDQSEINSIEKLVESEKLTLTRYNTKSSKIHSDEYLLTYLENLKETFSQHNNYPLLDKGVSHLVNLGIKEGKITVTKGTNERIKHSKLTLTILERLPSFDLASIDEVIDIRSELDVYLTRFRSAIIQYTDLIQSDITDDDLAYEIDKLIIKEINPIILEIDEQCRENNYLRELGYTLLNSKWVQIAGVGLALGNVFDVFGTTTSAVTGAVGTGVNAANSYRQWKEKQTGIEQSNLFFYYSAGQRFTKRID